MNNIIQIMIIVYIMDIIITIIINKNNIIMIMNYKKIFMIIYQISNGVGMMLNIQVEILKNLLKYFLMKPHNMNI